MFSTKKIIPYIIHTHPIILFGKMEFCDSQIVFEDGRFYIIRKSIHDKATHVLLTFAKSRDTRVLDGFVRGYIYDGNNEIAINTAQTVKSLIFQDEIFENVCIIKEGTEGTVGSLPNPPSREQGTAVPCCDYNFVKK
jgi:hypothetical protein